MTFPICRRDSARGSVTWTVRKHGNAWYTNASYTILSFIHRSTLVFLMPKIWNYTRTRIELFYNQGFHLAGIFKTLKSKGLQVSLSGITRLIKKLPLTGSVANLPRSGRPKKLSMEARAFIDQQMRRNDETTSAKIRKKPAKRGILVSSSTVRRSRKQKIYYYSSIWWQWLEQAHVFISKRKFDEIVLFVRRKIRSKSLELSLELSHEISKKVRENKKRNSRISLALLLHNTVFDLLFQIIWKFKQ